jgi:hypothetical protein
MGVVITVGNRPDMNYQDSKDLMDKSSRGGSYYGVVTQFIAHGLETIANGGPWYNVN